MSWLVIIDPKAKKVLSKIPTKDAKRIIRWTVDIEAGKTMPKSGDVKVLRDYAVGYRKRIGSYRIFFDIIDSDVVIYIVEIKRRTSKTYK